MPRQSRIDAPGALHHIIVRGIEKKNIFRDDQDRNRFLDRLGSILRETSTSCYAWALIPNHFHLLLRTGAAPVATVMRRLLTGHAVTFNRRHRRHGHLFQNRYKSILCQEDAYFLELVRYIHLNPLRAGLVEDYDELCRYSYCGHSVILGREKNDWQEIDYVLASFSGKRGQARKGYRRYVLDGVEAGKRDDLVGGGLIRSLGGWKEVSRLQAGGASVKWDERILGDSSFVLEVLTRSNESFERRYDLRARGYDIQYLAARVADVFGLEPKDVFDPGKYRKSVAARSVFCCWAVRELGITATALAERLRMTQPAVSISVRRGQEIVGKTNLQLEKIL